MSTKDLAMGLARLDHHGIAPIILGGVYTIVKVLDNDSEESQAAMTIPLELAGIVAVWTKFENRQISQGTNSRLVQSYKKLGNLIVRLYEGIIVLFGIIIAYLEKNRFCGCSRRLLVGLANSFFSSGFRSNRASPS